MSGKLFATTEFNLVFVGVCWSVSNAYMRNINKNCETVSWDWFKIILTYFGRGSIQTILSVKLIQTKCKANVDYIKFKVIVVETQYIFVRIENHRVIIKL